MLALTALLIAAATVSAPDVNGRWDLKAGETTIFRMEIVKTPAGTSATWERPQQFETDGESFSRISGPVVRRQARSVRPVEGGVELLFDDPEPGATPDQFRLRRLDADHIEVTYERTGFEPFKLTRATPRASQLGGWEVGRSYVDTINRPTNAEMTAIFDADQADRRATEIDWSVVGPADEKRRARTEELLNSGALQSGEDFYHAAFILQHGAAADDCLKAHLLAMVAIARGKPGATWIASATLDRYLQTIGKPQVLGTQFSLSPNTAASQEPYNRALVSDAMRKALRVPPIAEQEKQRLQMEQQSSMTKKTPK